MRKVLVCLVLATAVARADRPIPQGYDRVEISDLTFTLRDDDFATISADPADAKTVYVGTYQGRFYKTTDGGKTWTEATVIAEQELLWQTSGSTIFFGGVRSAGDSPTTYDLIGRDSPLQFAHIPSGLGRLPLGPAPLDGLGAASAAAAGGGGAFLGVGLSSRSPRLSILTGSRGRPVPVLNRGRLLVDRTLRGTAVLNITASPSDRRLLFAATMNGLYVSRDAGESWARTFAGLTSAERVAQRIAIRPGNPELLVLGTTNGAYLSTDQGDNWSKITTVGGAIADVAFDRKDSKFIYLATNGGVMRSNDGGATFEPIYYSTFPAENDVHAIAVDPFDSTTVYIATSRGAYVTHAARTTRGDDWAPLGGEESVLAIAQVSPCPKHEGHIIMSTRINLTAINYGADGPESAIIESWDGGRTWRRIFGGQSDGTIAAYANDTDDPDQLWIAWTKALHRLERGGGDKEDRSDPNVDSSEFGPPIGAVVLAALHYQGLELTQFVEDFHLPRGSSILPHKVVVTGDYRKFSVGGTVDAVEFTSARYLETASAHEWRVMVLLSWNLPELRYSADTVPLLRQRVNTLTDELRRRVVETVRRSYGELLRIRAELASSRADLQTRVMYRLRAEQLEAIVDLASGGYLTRWNKHRRTR